MLDLCWTTAYRRSRQLFPILPAIHHQQHSVFPQIPPRSHDLQPSQSPMRQLFWYFPNAFAAFQGEASVHANQTMQRLRKGNGDVSGCRQLLPHLHDREEKVGRIPRRGNPPDVARNGVSGRGQYGERGRPGSEGVACPCYTFC